MNQLELEGVCKSYSGGERTITALDQISLIVRAGEILSVLGLNGAGKTTLVKIIAGLIEPERGTIRLDGVDGTSRKHYRKCIGEEFGLLS